MLDTSSGTPVLSVENIETYYGPSKQSTAFPWKCAKAR